MSDYLYQATIEAEIECYVEDTIEETNLERIGREDSAEVLRKQTRNMVAELGEAYRKAEAFDRIAKNLAKYDDESPDTLNTNYHDFGIDTAHTVDKETGRHQTEKEE